MELKIFKINLPHSFTPKESEIAEGSFGKIFNVELDSEKYVTKFIAMKNHNKKKLASVLQEIFFTKIASALKVGAEFADIYGYDAIVFNDGISFALERCQASISAISQQSLHSEIKEQNLKKGLKTLHSLHICHSDIKKPNVAWSFKKEKMVFIDFGFTNCYPQTVGEKTKTRFVGTFQYCSPEMKKLFLL